MSDFLRYYTANFLPLDQACLEAPSDYAFTKHNFNQWKQTTPVMAAITMSYRRAFALTVPDRAADLILQERPLDEFVPIMATVGRTWHPWLLHLADFFKDLSEFAKARSLKFN